MTVAGTSTLNGQVLLLPQGTATASEAFNSQFIKLSSSAYNSSSKSVVSPRFQLQVEPTGNDTASPNGTLNLLASATASAPAETGFFINTNGTIHFAPGQTFPGTGNITSVGLSAPSSDFTVSGSPVTGAGTLGLNWKVAPTSADNANAIVKRDASGSFTRAQSPPVWGWKALPAPPGWRHTMAEATRLGRLLAGGRRRLYGEALATGSRLSGVRLCGRRSWGCSLRSRSGVAGVNNAGGVGVYGTGGTGVFGTGSNYGFVTDSNVQQARTAGGWIKAMVEVDENSSINRCFNSTLTGAAATTPPCGIDLEHPESGTYNFNFNFEVDDRFYTTQILYDSTLALAIYRNGTNGLQVLSYFAVGDQEMASIN